MDVIEAKARQCELDYSDRDRKRFGTHYTPDAVVDYIVKRVLRPMTDQPDSLQSIRVLDPACGSGLFLLKAYEILADCWHKANGGFRKKDARHILEHCLFGIDIADRAVSATKTHLLQKASLCETDSAFLDNNIVVGDALSLAHPSTLIPMHNRTTEELSPVGIFAKRSFDCVIGNPPYVRIQNTPSEKRGYYTSSYTTASGRFDVSTLFIELSEYLLKENGRFGFIVSNKVLSTSGAKGLRKFLLTQFNLEEIVDLADTKLFAAAVLPMILIARRPGRNGERACPTSRIVYSSITESHGVTASALPTDNILHLLDNSEIPFEVNVSFAKRIFRLQRFYADTPSSTMSVRILYCRKYVRILFAH
jgi:type I restriction-modification system DNA methylase subunit